MNIFHLSLALLMLITGSINTLSVKWADTMTSESTDGKQHPFRHPFLQACGMFVGEMLCMVAFYIVKWYRRRRTPNNQPSPSESGFQEIRSDDEVVQEQPKFSPFVFLPPALCDMTATSIQYIGLTLTYASSFQMLRGAVIVFTGILSRIFLSRKIKAYKWIGIFFVIAGLVIVGLCDVLSQKSSSEVQSIHEFFGVYHEKVQNGTTPSNHSANHQLLGDILIVCAQVIVASQMVYEEKFITKYNVPALQAVGWEGTWGFLCLATLLIPFYFIPDPFGQKNNPRGVLEDAYDGLYQLSHNPYLATAFCGTVISIAFFNFAGISVTKEMSATTRMVLDSIRTLVIWGVSMAIGWQGFQALQLLGFLVLITGMCIYNDIVFAPLGRKLINLYRSRYNRLEENVEDSDAISNPNEQQEPQRNGGQ